MESVKSCLDFGAQILNSTERTCTNNNKFLNEELQTYFIANKKFETFYVCNTSKVDDYSDAFKIVVKLLRYKFYNADYITVQLTFCTMFDEAQLAFCSNELKVWHHYDIFASVHELFTIMRIKIDTIRTTYSPTKSYIQCVKVNVTGNRYQHDEIQRKLLPLQFRLKKHGINVDAPLDVSKEFCDNMDQLITLTRKLQLKSVKLYRNSDDDDDDYNDKAVEEYLTNFGTTGNGDQLKSFNAHLHCFKFCFSKDELFVEPFYINENAKSAPHYIIIEDIMGKFQGLLKIDNIQEFVRDDRIYATSCRKCERIFYDHIDLEVHKILKCGDEFHIYGKKPFQLPRNCVRIKTHFANNMTVYGELDEQKSGDMFDEQILEEIYEDIYFFLPP